MIHEKFKDDVSHHLEDFKSTIEGLEANHSELKGAIKKQSMLAFFWSLAFHTLQLLMITSIRVGFFLAREVWRFRKSSVCVNSLEVYLLFTETSHQKLIAHFEGGIETKLDDATKRINSVNEASLVLLLRIKFSY